MIWEFSLYVDSVLQLLGLGYHVKFMPQINAVQLSLGPS